MSKTNKLTVDLNDPLSLALLREKLGMAGSSGSSAQVPQGDPKVIPILETEQITFQWCPFGATWRNPRTGETGKYKAKPGRFALYVQGSKTAYFTPTEAKEIFSPSIVKAVLSIG